VREAGISTTPQSNFHSFDACDAFEIASLRWVRSAAVSFGSAADLSVSSNETREPRSRHHRTLPIQQASVLSGPSTGLEELVQRVRN
jgi:hypothetical protein